MNNSLLEPPVQQLSLIPATDEPFQVPAVFFAEQEARGVFTAERLFDQRPEVYRSVVALSAEGKGQILIGEILRVSPNTVRAVQKRERRTIDILKERAGEHALDGAWLCFEEITRRLENPAARALVSMRDLAVTGGILAQRGLELRGEVMPSVDVAAGFEAGAQAFAAFIQAMRSPGNAPAQKEAAAADLAPGEREPGGPQGARAPIDVEATADLQSGAKPHETP